MNEKDILLERIEQLRVTIMENEKEEEKHLKGYIYDSLVFRYKLALEQGFKQRVREYLKVHPMCTAMEVEDSVRRLVDRDFMRFCEILNEAIGEHD